jgi:hypothetical protein
MKARVLSSYPLGVVMAFGGHEFVKRKWRVVPGGYEQDAANHPYLETDEGVDDESSRATKQRGGSRSKRISDG